MSNAICALGSCSVNAVAGDRIFIGQSTIGTSLFELETPYADPHVRCCERCDAKHPPTRLIHPSHLISECYAAVQAVLAARSTIRPAV